MGRNKINKLVADNIEAITNNYEKFEEFVLSLPTDKKSNEEIIQAKQHKFHESLVPYVALYGKDMIERFYNYFAEPTKNNKKFKWETYKTWCLRMRLRRWEMNSNEYRK